MIKWKYEENIDPEKFVGFVYKITELDTEKKYIGIKKFWEIEKKKPNKYLKKDGIFVKDRYGKRKLFIAHGKTSRVK